MTGITFFSIPYCTVLTGSSSSSFGLNEVALSPCWQNLYRVLGNTTNGPRVCLSKASTNWIKPLAFVLFVALFAYLLFVFGSVWVSFSHKNANLASRIHAAWEDVDKRILYSSRKIFLATCNRKPFSHPHAHTKRNRKTVPRDRWTWRSIRPKSYYKVSAWHTGPCPLHQIAQANQPVWQLI